MIILGLQIGAKLETEYNRSGYKDHDSAAVLIRDGEIIAAIEEERLSRIKHCNFFPRRAIDFCMRQGGITLGDVDIVAVGYSESNAHAEAAYEAYEDISIKMKSGAEFLSKNFEVCYKQNISDKLFYCSHHLAHAWSSFTLSGFDESLVVILDGDAPSSEGRKLSGLVGVSEKEKFKVVREISGQKSLGNFFTSIIKLIGYDRFDEYKVMGLAPYGDPAKYRRLFKELYNLRQNGDYEIHEDAVQHLWYSLLEKGGIRSLRRKGEPIEQAHKDMAAALQESLETIALHFLTGLKQEFHKDHLCFAGGVAHNCTLNGRIEKSGLFRNMFVQPAAHDAGIALGAALYAESVKGKHRYSSLEHLFYGTSIPRAEEIIEELSEWKPMIRFDVSKNVSAETAHLLANDAVIGWVQGRSEFGPRALGNRSILADPRPGGNKSRINEMIKKREGYRPFAPSVLAERATEFFDIDSNSKSLFFMNLVTLVREEKRALLGAITHIDGTARIQCVRRETNSRYWELINEFGNITGVPILLNTSFNNNVEPIVDSVADAIVCFLTTGLTHLVIDNCIIYKDKSLTASVPNLYVRVKESCKLASGYTTVDGAFINEHSIESNASRYFSKPSTRVSEDLFRIISFGNSQTIGEIATSFDIDLDNTLIQEILKLWGERALCLSPVLITPSGKQNVSGVARAIYPGNKANAVITG